MPRTPAVARALSDRYSRALDASQRAVARVARDAGDGFGGSEETAKRRPEPAIDRSFVFPLGPTLSSEINRRDKSIH